MSIILSWENPTSLWEKPTASKAELWANASGGFQKIADDIIWGFHELPDGDVDGSYRVEYRTPGGGSIAVEPTDIMAWVRPAASCLITGELVRPDGSPDSFRSIAVTDRDSDGQRFNRRYVSNLRGQIAFLMMPGAQILIRVDGAMKAWDVAIPDLRDLDFYDLPRYGSIIDTDRRGWY